MWFRDFTLSAEERNLAGISPTDGISPPHCQFELKEAEEVESLRKAVGSIGLSGCKCIPASQGKGEVMPKATETLLGLPLPPQTLGAGLAFLQPKRQDHLQGYGEEALLPPGS